MSARHLALGLLSLAACNRNLDLPPLPGPGNVSGRVVYAVPGRTDRRPAVGATVTLVGSSIALTTGSGGTFRLEGIDQTEGLLLFRFDSDADGVVDRQKALQLAEWGSGPGKTVFVGDVVLGENASVHGKVLRGDLAPQRSGHAGTAVFVPEGPFSAFTSDDGSYLVPNLPEGPLQFFVFRTGYEARSLGTVELRSGEDFSFHDVTLNISTEPQVPGSLKGTLRFVPAVTGAGDTAIVAQTQGQADLQGTVAADLSFSFVSVPPGVYALRATRSGYTAATKSNLLVLPGQEAVAGELTLGNQPEPDAGTLAPADAGAAPCVGGKCRACTGNADCASSDWCDDGYCAPQCGTIACTNGRACDLVTRTCIYACTGGCPGALRCHAASNICRAACDLTFTCAAGFRCDAQSQCVPECAVPADCSAQHLTCQAGQCVPNTLCQLDADCAPEKMCLAGTCTARPTGANDAGIFSCTRPCDCKLGETCALGFCQSDPLPTRYAASGGTGDGSKPNTPTGDLAGVLADAGPGTRIALTGDAGFYSEEPFLIHASQVSLTGGYVACAPDRWVRDPSRRTLLVADAGVVLLVKGSTQLESDRVRNLELRPTDVECSWPPAASGYTGLIDAYDTRDLRLENVRGSFPDMVCTNHSRAVAWCQTCEALRFSDLTLGPAASHSTHQYAVSLNLSSGDVARTVVEPQLVTQENFYAVRVENPNAATTVTDTTIGRMTAALMYGIYLAGCGTAPIRIERMRLEWPVGVTNGAGLLGIFVGSCTNVDLMQNTMVHDGVPQGRGGGVYGVWSQGGGGSMVDNVIDLPPSVGTGTQYGLYVVSANGALRLEHNTISGGASSTATTYGIYISGSVAPSQLIGNRVDLGPSFTPTAMTATSLLSGGPIELTDNFFSARGGDSCLAGTVTGLYVQAAVMRAERNRFFAKEGGTVYALHSYDAQLELYNNHLWAGRTGCGTAASEALLLDYASRTWAFGNTLDARGGAAQTGPTRAIETYAVAELVAQNNIIGAGRSPTHFLIYDPVGTSLPVLSFDHNYFWYETLGASEEPTDGVLQVVDAGFGVLDPQGNRLNRNVSCWLDAGVSPDGGEAPYLLRPGSLCVDQGVPMQRHFLLNAITDDIDGRGRDAGAVDLGCSELR